MTGSPYNAVHIEGGLLSADLIERIRSAARDLPGNRPKDYHLAAGERIGEAVSRKWDYLKGAYRAFRERLDALPPTDSPVTETRERWLLRLFDELGFGRLTYLRGGIVVGETAYPISHHLQACPSPMARISTQQPLGIGIYGDVSHGERRPLV